jgi:hypothetical protein
MFTAKTKISTLSKYQVVKLANIIVEFCQINLGKKRNKQFPKLVLSYKNEEDWGCYDPEEHIVYVYVNNIPNVSELSKTIIHEWTHTKQNIIGEYGRLYRKHGYDEHPMEIEAYASEKIWNRKSLYYLRKKLN